MSREIEPRFEEGDDVEVDVPEDDDPMHIYHAQIGTVKFVGTDDLAELTGNELDSEHYIVQIGPEEIMLRGTDVIPVNG